MSFRPQFAFSTPPGFRDEEFEYSFDSSNAPGLGVILAAGDQITDIPLVLEDESPFVWHAVKLQSADTPGINGGAVSGFALSIRLRDPYGNFLSDDYVPVSAYVSSGESGTIGTQGLALESPIVCPQGGIVSFFGKNTAVAAMTLGVKITLLGLKRFTIARCP